jgi:hypothetical protein
MKRARPCNGILRRVMDGTSSRFRPTPQPCSRPCQSCVRQLIYRQMSVESDVPTINRAFAKELANHMSETSG